MSPMTHLLASWILAERATDNTRDCRLATLAGILPDADGLGLVVDVVRPMLGLAPTQYYARYHHYLLHGAFGAVLIAGLLACLARRKLRVVVVALVLFHLHLLCDLAGSRGPAPEDLWAIYYAGPFDRDPMWLWKGQWRLDGWQNRIIGVTVFVYALWRAPVVGHSVVGVFNRRVDAVLVGVLQKWRLQLSQLLGTGKWSRNQPPPPGPESA
jgi:hypothetical protein